MDARTLLYRALMSRIGVVVSGPSPRALQQALYAARKADSAFNNLEVRVSPIVPDEFWIFKNAAGHAPPPSTIVDI